MVVTVVLESREATTAADAAEAAGRRLLLVPQVDGRYARVGTIAALEEAGAGPRGGRAVLLRGLERAVIGTGVPGRGLWVEASREAVDAAVKRGLFSRAAKTKLTAAADLADQVDALLARRALERLGLARRAGALTWGFEKASAAIASGKVAWMVEAADGSPDGRRKLLQIARKQPRPPRLC
ncbi:MAG TPA: DUF448 domain-containing protein, partial [Thermomicrobiales bacterium]|nr:DUF448 domain-containing protein [Thermomicrobiales bacterium]